MRLRMAALAALVLVTAADAAAEPQSFADLSQDKHGALVRLGYRLFTDTPNSARRYVGNRLSCKNCHLDDGQRANAAPMGPAFVAYPAWRSKDDRVTFFEDRVQQCFRFSLNGIPPTLGSIELQALTAYAAWLAKGLPMGEPMVTGRGLYQIPKTGRDPNPDRGRAIYRDRCAACHDSGATPPVWGLQSYNQGAGLATTTTLAGFVKKNMPPGDASLTDQDALDVAAYINFQVRPPDPRASIWSLVAK